jgi:WXXGXW repeat (2 copies)
MALAASSLGVSLATYAAIVIVDVAPPAARYEDAQVRQGYIYAPGYYQWDQSSRQHVWVKGDYQPERRGEHWVAHRWTEKTVDTISMRDVGKRAKRLSNHG